MKGLVVSSGSLENYDLLEEQVMLNDYIICADGGLDHLRKINKIPDIVLGDLDSITDDGLSFINENDIKVEKFPVMKDMTDTELALEYLVKKGFKNITLMGVLGTRMDHSLGNIYLLKRLFHKGVKGRIVDSHNTLYFTNEHLKLNKKDKYVSVIPISDNGIIVTLEGFLYPLDKYHIGFGSTIGISNEIVKDFGEIIIHNGEAIVIESID